MLFRSPNFPAHEDTVYLCVVDPDGNAVSFINSLFHGFGSGIVGPATGVTLQNRGAGFVLAEGHPNCIAPGKRPLSSMSPTLVLRDGQPAGIIGSPGGPRIITTVVQVLLNIVEFGMDVQAAVDYPRVHHQWKPDILFLEDGIANDVAANLIAKGHRVVLGGAWSAAQCIWIDGKTGLITGGTDHRIEGAAVGY